MPRLTFVFVIIATLAFAAACGDDDDNGDAPTAQPTTAASPTAAATEPSATETVEPFEGGRDPITQPSSAGEQIPPLVDVRTGEHDGFERVTFEFEGGLPGYTLQYVDEPIECGSGFPVFEDRPAGSAVLEVSFTPAVAHTEAGEPTIDQDAVTPPPGIEDVDLSCDFEGVVTWALLLSEERDFRATAVDGPPRLAVDIASP